MKKIISGLLILLIMLSFVFPFSGGAAHAATATELFLCVGSPIALSDGKILPIDSQNPDLVPFVHKNRTLVPLRFVSEFFGADVSYDEAKGAGVVKVGGKTAVFPVGESYYLLDEERVDLDTETLSVAGRIFLPLRSLCENVLGLEVDYASGVILVAAKARLTDTQIRDVKDRIGMYVKVTSLGELKDALYSGKSEYPEADAAEPPVGEVLPEDAIPEEDDSLSDGDYSETNTQVDGVDEADIIKTDGKYIYLLSSGWLTVVSALDTMSVAARVEMEEGRYAQEMYVNAGRLVIIGTRYAAGSGATPKAEYTAAYDAPMQYYEKSFTFVNVYDISDLSSVSLLRSFEIEGYHTASRRQGDYVYLLTNISVWQLDKGDPRPLIGENGDLKAMPVDDILIMPDRYCEGYLTLSAINIRDTDEKVESESIVGSGYVTYMSNSAVYVAASTMYTESLSIARFSVDGGKVGYSGSGVVNGYLNNQFSMDEYKGYLRVATTVWSDKSMNNLYVLDENLQVSGSVLGFAPDERIYSVRFMGERGYIVTFRQVDPLFVFDLSNPANPKITGELKVPGFSSYLHPISENVILGVGTDVKDIYIKDGKGNEVVVGQQTGGIKLSLFDVSDMGKPKEIDTLVIGDRGYSGMQYNHKAAMFKKDAGILAFSADLYSYDYREHWTGAVVVSYLNNRFVELGRIATDGSYDGYDLFYEHRLVYIGDTLYYVQNGVIRSFDMSTLTLKQSLPLVQ